MYSSTTLIMVFSEHCLQGWPTEKLSRGAGFAESPLNQVHRRIQKAVMQQAPKALSAPAGVGQRLPAGQWAMATKTLDL
jgi:hypothetical protein